MTITRQFPSLSYNVNVTVLWPQYHNSGRLFSALGERKAIGFVGWKRPTGSPLTSLSVFGSVAEEAYTRIGNRSISLRPDTEPGSVSYICFALLPVSSILPIMSYSKKYPRRAKRLEVTHCYSTNSRRTLPLCGTQFILGLLCRPCVVQLVRWRRSISLPSMVQVSQTVHKYWMHLSLVSWRSRHDGPSTGRQPTTALSSSY